MIIVLMIIKSNTVSSLRNYRFEVNITQECSQRHYRRSLQIEVSRTFFFLWKIWSVWWNALVPVHEHTCTYAHIYMHTHSVCLSSLKYSFGGMMGYLEAAKCIFLPTPFISVSHIMKNSMRSCGSDINFLDCSRHNLDSQGVLKYSSQKRVCLQPLTFF